MSVAKFSCARVVLSSPEKAVWWSIFVHVCQSIEVCLCVDMYKDVQMSAEGNVKNNFIINNMAVISFVETDVLTTPLTVNK